MWAFWIRGQIDHTTHRGVVAKGNHEQLSEMSFEEKRPSNFFSMWEARNQCFICTNFASVPLVPGTENSLLVPTGRRIYPKRLCSSDGLLTRNNRKIFSGKRLTRSRFERVSSQVFGTRHRWHHESCDAFYSVFWPIYIPLSLSVEGVGRLSKEDAHWRNLEAPSVVRHLPRAQYELVTTFS